VSEPGRRVTLSARPFNAETPLAALAAAEGLTPVESFFVRCNFDVPVLDPSEWRLRMEGRVSQRAILSLGDVMALPHREVTATIECAGNGRRLMRPVPGGTAWGLGAASTGVFGGTSLANVLRACGLQPEAVEVVCEGADAGPVRDDGVPVRFARSLPLDRALHPDTLLAWTLNGEPLAPEHGFPLRVLVPGWYGVASVKWLTRLVAVEEPFAGYFQAERYVYRGHPEYAPDAPVREMHVRALVTSVEPARPGAADGAGQDHDGTCVVRGVAWSGFGAVTCVEVSDDGGVSWLRAVLEPAPSPHAARAWRCRWTPAPGAHEFDLAVRATDASGRSQPVEPVWNELGYANNGVQRIRLRPG